MADKPDKPTKPWRGWYHCIGNTYGTWLYGDDRGFRTRHHQEHIVGDYKNPPPPGQYDEKLQRSQQMMQRDAVTFPVDMRALVCRLFGDALLFHKAELAELAIDAIHFHALARFIDCTVTIPRSRPRSGERGLSAYDMDPVPRTVLGKVRSYTTHQLKQMGYFTEVDGGLWAKRPQILPVESEAHWEHLRANYIPDHVHQGAAIWSQLPPCK